MPTAQILIMMKINLDRARKIYRNLEKDIQIFFEQWAES
jgi:hypothetical protein